jgi:non-ribosomal peptide synthase protein (TIGR01720 family)
LQQWAAHLDAQARHDDLLEEKSYWLAQLSAPHSALPVNPAASGDESASVTVRLPAAYTRAWLDEGESAYGISRDAALLAGLLKALTRWAAIGEICIDIEHHDRHGIDDRFDLSQTLGNCARRYPMALSCAQSDSSAELMRMLQRRFGSVPGKGEGYSLLRYLRRDEEIIAAERARPSPVLFRCFGSLDQETTVDPAFRAAQPFIDCGNGEDDAYLLQLNCMVIEGCLSLQINYRSGHFTAGAVEMLAALLRNSCEDVIEHCRSKAAGGYLPPGETLADIARVGGAVRYHPLPANRHWYFKRTVDLHAWGSCTALELPGEGDYTALVKQAITHVQSLHDGLRLQLVQAEGRWYERVADIGMLDSFRVEDLSSIDEEKRESAFNERFELHKNGIDLSKTLFKAVYFRMGRGHRDRIMLVVHHLAVDQYASSLLMTHLADTFAALAQHKPLIPKASGSTVAQWAEAERRWANSEQARENLDYWSTYDLSGFNPLPTDFAHTPQENSIGSTIEVVAKLTQEETERFTAYVKRNPSAAMIHVLLAGMVEGFQQWTGTRSLCVELVDSGREPLSDDVDVLGTVGWVNDFIPLFIDLGNARPGKAALQAAIRCYGQSMKYGKGLNALKCHVTHPALARRLAAIPEPEVAINFLPPEIQAPAAGGATGALSFMRWEPMIGEKRERIHLLGCQISFVNGQLQFAWNFSRNVYRQSTIENLASYCVRELLKLVDARAIQSDADGVEEGAG